MGEDMGQRYIKTKTSGVRYREHPTRKFGIQKDKYYSIRYKLNGKDKEECLGWASQGWSEKKAAEYLFELKKNQRTGEGAKTLAEKRKIGKSTTAHENEEIIETIADHITFDETWEKYVEAKRTCVTKGYLNTEQCCYKTWIRPKLSKLKLINIKIDDIQNVISNVLDKRSPKTASHVKATIRQVFNFAIARELYFKKNPVSEVKIRMRDNRRNRYLTAEEANILLNELKKHSLDMHDIALTALYEGLRANEIFSLQWKDVNLQANYLAIMNTKNGVDRMQPLHPKVKEVLLRRRTEDSSGYIFKNRNGEKIREVSSTFSRVVNALGFNKDITENKQKIVFHSLRHTYASWLVMRGVDLYATQHLMGHKNIQMTQRYAHLSPEYLEKAVNCL